MARDKGKRPLIDERSKPVFKKTTKTGGSRSRNAGIVIEEPSNEPRSAPSDSSDDSVPLALAQRFISPEARAFYDQHYSSCKILYERAIDKGKVNPAFLADLRKMGMAKMIDIPARLVNNSLVREFFANLDDKHLADGFVMVRKKQVPFTSALINKKLGLKVFKTGEGDFRDFIKQLDDAGRDPLESLRQDIHKSTPWTMTADGKDRREIVTSNWPEDARVKCRFIQRRILPKDNIGHMVLDDLAVLYMLTHRKVFNVGKAIYDEVKSCVTNRNRLIMAPYLIHSLCLDAKVKEYNSDNRLKRKPRAIQREKKRLKVLGEMEDGDEEATAAAPTRQVAPFERMVLSMAKSISDWFADSREVQDCILENQRRICQQLKIESMKTLENEPLFLYENHVQNAIDRNAFTDSEASEEEVETATSRGGDGAAEGSSSSSDGDGDDATAS